MQTAVHNRRVKVNGLRVHYLAAGETGSSVILLHGGGLDCAALTYRYAIAPLARDHRVFAPDLPGYGRTDKPKVDYTIDYYVAFLDRFMDILGLERASLVGLSMGGGIALGFTLSHPDRVDRLVLVDAYGLGGEAPWPFLSYLYVHIPGLSELTLRLTMRSRTVMKWSLRANTLGNPEAATDDLVEEIRRLAHPDSARAFASFQKSELGWTGLRTNFADRLSEIAVPTLIVHGEMDRLVPVAWARRAHERIHGSRLVILPGVGHWSTREQPERFNEIVTRFLEESDREGTGPNPVTPPRW